MTTMVEKVARAIALRDSTDECAMARAAIEAMREPTDEMVTAAEMKMSRLARLQIRFLFETMVDAALDENPA